MKNKCRKFKRNYIFTFTLLLLTIAITYNAWAKSNRQFPFYNTLTAFTDTTLPVKDTIPAHASADSALTPPDSLVTNDSTGMLYTDSSEKRVKTDTFDIKVSKDSIDAPVNYKALDSMVLDVAAKKTLHVWRD